MGLFDGAVQGWNALTKAAGDVQKNIEGGVKGVQEWGEPVIKDTQKNVIEPIQKPIEDTIKFVERNNVVSMITNPDNSDVVQTVKDNPIVEFVERNNVVSMITNPDNSDVVNFVTKDIPSTVNDTWEKTTETVNNTIKEVNNTVEKTIIQPVKETVGNVGKGLKDALPYVAIGGAALIAANLLLGRR